MTPNEFCSALICQLVSAGTDVIHPRHAGDIRGFHAILKSLDSFLDSPGEDTDQWRQLLRIRNRISPGNTGAFDRFEDIFRDLQTSLVWLPCYGGFVFSVPEPFAKSLIEELAPFDRQVIEASATAFLNSQGDGS